MLVTDNVLKIADLGLAREVMSMPPYTEYVSTRWWVLFSHDHSYLPAFVVWIGFSNCNLCLHCLKHITFILILSSRYRAPEVLLQSSSYTPAIGMGCYMFRIAYDFTTIFVNALPTL